MKILDQLTANIALYISPHNDHGANILLSASSCRRLIVKQINDVGSEPSGNPEKAAEQSVEGKQFTVCGPILHVNKKMEEMAHINWKGQEQLGSERDANVAEGKRRP